MESNCRYAQDKLINAEKKVASRRLWVLWELTLGRLHALLQYAAAAAAFWCAAFLQGL